MSRSESDSATTSSRISIEDALNAFDFLEVEDQEDEAEFIDGFTHNNNNQLQLQHTQLPAAETHWSALTPPSSARTADSGIDCSHTKDVTPQHSDITVCSSCGNVQLDRVAAWHFGHCVRLIQSLSSSPQVLKYREGVTMEKLKRQTEIVANLVKIAKTYSNRAVDLPAGV